MVRERIRDWLEPIIDRIDARIQAWADSRARIVRVESDGAPPYYVVEVKSFGRWVPRVFSTTADIAEAEQWLRRETGRESWPPAATRTPL
jgi:hypothetical protein